MHIKRFLDRLDQIGVKYAFQNQYSISKISLLAKITYFALVKETLHLHLFSKHLLLVLLPISWLPRKNNVVVTIHHDRFPSMKWSSFWHFIISRIHNVHFICVSEVTYQWIAVSSGSTKKRINSFIYPTNQNEVSGGAKRFNRMVMNLWSYYDGSYDDYGLDYFIEIAIRFPELDSVIYLGDVTTEELLRNKLSKECRKSIRVISGKMLVDELQLGDIFIRPNRTDAYGVSVAEAIHKGIPSLASDVCIRPNGAIICNKLSDYLCKIEKLTKNAPYEIKSDLEKIKKDQDSFQEIFEVLRKR